MAMMPQVEATLLDAIRRDQLGKGRRRSLRRPALAVAVAVCLGSGAALASGVWPDIRDAVRHGARPSVPNAALPLLRAHGRASLDRFRGQVVVVSFWAAWCAPCISQTPALAALNRELHATRTGTVVLVSTQESAGQARAALQRQSLRVPVLMTSPADPDAEAFFRAFLGSSSAAVPVTFAVDRAGRVAGYTEGSVSLRALRSLLHRAEGPR